VQDFIARPAHPYSLGLKGSILEMGSRNRELVPVPGLPPIVTRPPTRCSFAERCTFAIDRCREELPALRMLESGHLVACHRSEEVISRAG